MNCPWSGYSPGTIQFCEERLCAWIAEPANTWSSLALCVAGAIILYKDGRWRSPGGLIAISAILTGLGSVAFHATGTFVGEVLDVAAMYLISGLFLVFPLRQTFGWTFGRQAVVFIALVFTSTALLIYTRISGIPVFALQLTIAILLELRLFVKNTGATDYTYLKAVLLLFTVAYGIWNLDFHDVVCNPQNHVLNGHAIWHLLNAGALYCYYRFQKQFQ